MCLGGEGPRAYVCIYACLFVFAWPVSRRALWSVGGGLPGTKAYPQSLFAKALPVSVSVTCVFASLLAFVVCRR